MQRRNFYLPVPDWYFHNGQSATGMGYREASANLTPQQQLLLGRQYIYDGTWHKIPTMGWMTLQLVGFYTRDPRVGLEPLHENLDRYEAGLFQYLASGAQFTVRGDRLYDTPETRHMVARWVDWFKEYREVLTGDIIHMARPNGRSLDYILHVNPQGHDRALLAVFNPTDRAIQTRVEVPLYYAGLDNQAYISHEGGAFTRYALDRTWHTTLQVEVPAGGFTWYVIR